MNSRERVVHHYELELRSYVPGATKIKSPSCREFIEIFDAIDKINPIGAILGSSNYRSLTIADWRFNKANRTLFVLLNQNDLSKSDVAFRDRANKTVRMAGKLPTEGIETSSYIALKFNHNNRIASLVMTMGAGITIDHVVKLFRALIDKLRQNGASQPIFEFPHPSGAIVKGVLQTYSVQYAIEWSVEKSEYLNKVLTLGTLEGVELIHDGSYNFDSAGNFVRERTAVTIKPTKSVSLKELKNAIDDFKRQGNSVESAKIFFRDPNGESKSTSLPVNGLTDAFVKKTRLTFVTDVTDQDAKFSKTILDPLSNLL